MFFSSYSSNKQTTALQQSNLKSKSIFICHASKHSASEEKPNGKKKAKRGKTVRRIFKCSIRYQSDGSFVLVTIFIKKILFTRRKSYTRQMRKKKCQSGFILTFISFSNIRRQQAKYLFIHEILQKNNF